jgi:hypothetical protein
VSSQLSVAWSNGVKKSATASVPPEGTSFRIEFP